MTAKISAGVVIALVSLLFFTTMIPINCKITDFSLYLYQELFINAGEGEYQTINRLV